MTFDLVVHNAGPSSAQQPLTVIDQLPDRLTFVSADAGWTCTAGAVTGAGQTVTCELDGADPIAADDDAPTLTLVVQVASDVTPGTLVTPRTSPQPRPTRPGNNDASDPVDVRAVVDLAVVKTTPGQCASVTR